MCIRDRAGTCNKTTPRLACSPPGMEVQLPDKRTNTRTDDGNQRNNGTADLETRSGTGGFIDAALNSLWSEQWAAAFDYLNPNSRLDFSDTVEALFILDVPLSRVRDTNDFADEFLRNTRQAVELSIQNRNFPQTWVSPLSQ